eukprot:gene13076-9365_t
MTRKAGTSLPTSYHSMPMATLVSRNERAEEEKSSQLRQMLFQSSVALGVLVAFLFIYHEVTVNSSSKEMVPPKLSTKTSSSAASTSNPNIVFVYVDDMGFSSIGRAQFDVYGMTPFINGLVNDGLYFSNYYAQEECTPSRAALMTGRYPITTGMQYHLVEPLVKWGLNLNETLLPEILRDYGGYATYGIGKWHLGHYTPDYLPTARGFDQFFGYLTGQIHAWSKLVLSNSNYYHDMTYMNDTCYYPYSNADDSKYSTELYGVKATSVIEAHDFSEQPMFLYLPFQAVHDPFGDVYEYTEGLNTSYIDESTYDEILERIPGTTRQQYAFSLYMLDRTVRAIYTSLADVGQLDNTLIILASDNGGCYNAGGRNGDLRGCKGTLFEGGFKVDALMYGPSILPSYTQGVNYTNLFHVSDWLPTLVGLLGIDYTPSEDFAWDGIDHSSYIQEWNQNGVYSAYGADGPRQSLIYNIYYNIDSKEEYNETTAPFALRDLRYKLIRTHVGNDYTTWYNYSSALSEDDDISRGSCTQTTSSTGTLSTMLFDLWDDPNETTNLYELVSESYLPSAYAAKTDLEALFNATLPTIAENTFIESGDLAATKYWKKHDKYILPWNAGSGVLSLCTPETAFG